MASMLCLGIDSGTTSSRALVLDLQSGNVLALAQRRHVFVEGLPHGHSEQDPQPWTEAVDLAVQECLAAIGDRREAIAAIGVSAQQHGLVVLDERNQPIRPAKLWCDTSTASESDELNKVFGGTDHMIERTGNVI